MSAPIAIPGSEVGDMVTLGVGYMVVIWWSSSNFTHFSSGRGLGRIGDGVGGGRSGGRAARSDNSKKCQIPEGRSETPATSLDSGEREREREGTEMERD